MKSDLKTEDASIECSQVPVEGALSLRDRTSRAVTHIQDLLTSGRYTHQGEDKPSMRIPIERIRHSLQTSAVDETNPEIGEVAKHPLMEP